MLCYLRRLGIDVSLFRTSHVTYVPLLYRWETKNYMLQHGLSAVGMVAIVVLARKMLVYVYHCWFRMNCFLRRA